MAITKVSSFQNFLPSADNVSEMVRKNRRRKFLVHRSFQLHYLFYIILTLFIVSATGMVGSYFGIWASVIDAFSQASVRNRVVTAAQISEYEQARQLVSKDVEAGLKPASPLDNQGLLRAFRETELLGIREQELIREIMNETNKRMVHLGFVLIILIGWSSIYLTHKVAGPIFKIKQYFDSLRAGDLTLRIQFRKSDEVGDLAPPFNEMVSSLDTSIGNMKRALREAPEIPLVQKLKRQLEHFKTTSDKLS